MLCQLRHSVRQDGSASQLEVANEESAVRVRPSPPLSRNCDGVCPLVRTLAVPIHLLARRGPSHPMKRLLSPLVALTAGSAVILGTHPALAHGTAAGGALGGLTHPLLGVDHLFMLMAVGTAASFISSQLLLWALGGAVIGAAAGVTGLTIASAEVIAALAISVVGGVILLAGRFAKTLNPNILTTISGAVVAAAISIHAMLHGMEAPKDTSTLLWWSGALISSALVCGGTYLMLRKLPMSVKKVAAVVFLAIGGLLAFGPLGLLAGGAGA